MLKDVLVSVRELLSAQRLQDFVILFWWQIDLVELPKVFLSALDVVDVWRWAGIVVIVALVDEVRQVAMTVARRRSTNPSRRADDFALRYYHVWLREVA